MSRKKWNGLISKRATFLKHQFFSHDKFSWESIFVSAGQKIGRSRSPPKQKLPKRRKNFGHRFQHRNTETKRKRRKTIIRVDLKHHSEKEKKSSRPEFAKKQHETFFCSLLATAMAKKIVHKFILFVLIFSEEKKRSPGVNFASSCF